MRAGLQAMLDAGDEYMDGIGSDVADPDVTESAYAKVPLAPLVSMLDGVSDLQGRFAEITAPALIMTSPQDHVVAPTRIRPPRLRPRRPGRAGDARAQLPRRHHRPRPRPHHRAHPRLRRPGHGLRLGRHGAPPVGSLRARTHQPRRRRPRRPAGPPDVDRRRARHVHRAARRRSSTTPPTSRPWTSTTSRRRRTRTRCRTWRGPTRCARASTATRSWPRHPRPRAACSACPPCSARHRDGAGPPPHRRRRRVRRAQRPRGARRAPRPHRRARGRDPRLQPPPRR